MTVQDSISAKVIAGFVGLAMAVTFAFAGAVSANAQDDTIAQLQAQIQALQAQLAALSGGSSSSALGCEATFTQNLTVGDQGGQVMQLQQFLNHQVPGVQVGAAGTAGGPGNETQYFGPKTQAAVTAFQNQNAAQVLAPVGLTNGTGYWGPSSRAHANAQCAMQQDDDDDMDEDEDEDEDDEDEDELQGGAGSLDSADFVSGLNNEEVGEDEDDAEVMGLEIEADDGSDIEIIAVTVDFDQNTADDDFEDYAEEVSIWLNGEKLAEVDADEFEDDDNYSQTISLDRGGIIRAGDEADLVVAVSGISNLDSADVGESWDVAIDSVRFRDAQNAIISDTSTLDITNTRTFTFESFAGAANAELNVSLADDNPESTVVDVDDSDDTDNVEILRFDLEAEGDSDLRVRDLPVNFASGTNNSGDVEDIINSATLEVDGEEFSESISASNNATTTFEDFDYTIDAGDTVEVVLTVDVNDTDGTFVDGDELDASVSAAAMNSADVEDESGEDLGNPDKTGTANGESMAFYDEGIFVTLDSVSTDTNVNDGSGDDTATFKIFYDVEAFDSDAFVSDNAVATDTASISTLPGNGAGVYYQVDVDGSATTTGLSGVVVFEPDGNKVTDSGVNNGVQVGDGNTGNFELSVTRSNSTSSDSGQYRMTLAGLSWDTSDQTHTNFYSFNLDDYRTSYVFID